MTWFSVSLLLWRMNVLGPQAVSDKYRHLQFLLDRRLAEWFLDSTIVINGSPLPSSSGKMSITSEGKDWLVRNTIVTTPWIISILALVVSVLAYFKK
jgi:hypothetical protein